MLYLEDKELLAQDSQRVETPITDVGHGVGVGRFGPLRRSVWSGGMTVVLAGVRGRVEARRGDGGCRSGGLGGSVWWT